MLPIRFARWLLLGLVLVLAVAPVATVSAEGQPPIREPWPFGPPVTLDVSVCGFPVLWESTADKGYLKTSTKDGATRSILTGILKLKATNLETGKTFEWVNPAQCTFMSYPDGSGSTACHGPSSLILMPDTPPLAVIQGTVSWSYDTSGNLLDYRKVGRVIDVCTALR